MGKAGGPCQGPGRNGAPICGETEVADSCDWRYGKEEHVGKACCTRKACREHLKVIRPRSPLVPAAEPAEAPGLAPPAATPPITPAGTSMFLDPEQQRQLQEDAQQLGGPYKMELGTRLLDRGYKMGMKAAEARQLPPNELAQRAVDDAAVIKMLQKHLGEAQEMLSKVQYMIVPMCDELYEPPPSKKRRPLDQLEDTRLATLPRTMSEVDELYDAIAYEQPDQLRARVQRSRE